MTFKDLEDLGVTIGEMALLGTLDEVADMPIDEAREKLAYVRREGADADV